MGLTALVHRSLGRLAVRRPHALVVAAPGWTAARLAVEDALAASGGVPALSPAEADLLITAGRPGDELAEAIDRLWRQVPGPAVALAVTDDHTAAGQIADALVDLAALTGSGPTHEDLPDGPMMADRGPDRDGLRLDVLHVPLGPVLPSWPAGLVVDVAMQGDVIQSARPRLLPGVAPTVYWSVPVENASGQADFRRAAAHLDSLRRLLAVVGWPAAAADAARCRRAIPPCAFPLSAAVSPEVSAAVSAGVGRLRRRLLGSRQLRRATDGLGVLCAEDAARWSVSGPAARAASEGGDATARWRTWLAEIDLALSGDDPAPGEGPRGAGPAGSAALLHAATTLMVGLDLAAARIVMASLDPDPDELTPATVSTDRARARGSRS